jgi:IS1 family transposase
MMVRGIGVRNISIIEGISIVKVLSVLVKSCYSIKPKCTHYASLEVDEFWTCVGEKKNKVWLIYTYDRESGEIVSFVWGKRDLKTARKLRKKLIAVGICYDQICTDNWESFNPKMSIRYNSLIMRFVLMDTIRKSRLQLLNHQLNTVH